MLYYHLDLKKILKIRSFKKNLEMIKIKTNFIYKNNYIKMLTKSILRLKKKKQLSTKKKKVYLFLKKIIK